MQCPISPVAPIVPIASMKILFRTFAIILSVLAVGIFVGFGIALFTVRFDLGGTLAFLLSAALAFLATRVAVWLWSDRPFWKDRKRAAEAATVGTAFLLIALVARLEAMTDGVVRTVVQLFAVGLVVLSYFIFRRIIPNARPPNATPNTDAASRGTLS